MKKWIGFWCFLFPVLSFAAVENIVATEEAFAALKSDGSVVVWGSVSGGGSPGVATYNDKDERWDVAALDSSLLASGVKKIYSNGYAFAAIKTGGAVVTWGNSETGGNSSAVASALASGVVSIVGTKTGYWEQGAFAALKSDGSVVVWGDPTIGGRASVHNWRAGTDTPSYTDLAPEALSSGVTKIVSSRESFAALKSDGSVVTWGVDIYGGSPIIYRNIARHRKRDISLFLEDGVVDIFSTEGAFAALKEDGSLVTWGYFEFGGDSSLLEAELGGFGATTKVVAVATTRGAFAAIRSDASVVTWGEGRLDGGDSSSVASDLAANIASIVPNDRAFAAITTGGGIVSWGYFEDQQEDIALVANPITSGVSQVFANHNAFAALKSDGSVVSWGWGVSDNATIGATELTSGVTTIVGHPRGREFAALKSDGTVLNWGRDKKVTVFGSGSNITKLFANKHAFAALKSDGTVVVWGDEESGGSLTGVTGL